MDKGRRKRIVKHLGKVGMSVVSVSLLLGSPSASAIDAADAAAQAVASEGGKEILSKTFEVARSKPALALAAGITCLACVPVAGVVTSPGMCVACGILIAKTLG
jgi:hypothetical protein